MTSLAGMTAAPLFSAVARQVREPTIICPLAGPVTTPRFEDVIELARAVVAGRPFTLALGRVSHPDVDDFTAIRVRVGGGCVATIGDRWSDEDDVRAAMRVVEASLRSPRQ